MPVNGREDDPSSRLKEAGDFGRRPPPRVLFRVRRFSARPGRCFGVEPPNPTRYDSFRPGLPGAETAAGRT
jgi:hypothetical protein